MTKYDPQKWDHNVYGSDGDIISSEVFKNLDPTVFAGQAIRCRIIHGGIRRSMSSWRERNWIVSSFRLLLEVVEAGQISGG